MTLTIEVNRLGLKYDKTSTALEDVSFRLEGGKIFGLLGRNGSGKTSLLSILASFQLQTEGEVRIDGEAPYENERIVNQVCFIQENGHMSDGFRVRDALKLAASCWPNWDTKYADRLIKQFELPEKKRVMALSRGMKSALGVTIGLASRAPVTIFDEAYLGMDAPSRYFFYHELLKDYMEHPRTFILSTHLIEEVGNLFEEVLILDKGKLVLREEAESLRTRGAAITGPAALVSEFAEGLTVLSEQKLGGTKSITVFGELGAERLKRAAADGLEIGPVSLQDLFVHLTRKGMASDERE
ncbi:ABC transporter ATP-binding protein [Paenibacillus sp. LHD-117]|uniref:ABC transporter ATP-binding protein n=1 Tax=Paenibacillus sp. LHD-117 TaxID=3071412 RepID=UPI0027E1BB4B|nr:ABC transporter ATP-binding protein [Paenibacillus sp. LHD-117]MDQ6420055.1 ABC transporter ATP-binding protein [Paenibacillus sp. LHD-117]